MCFCPVAQFFCHIQVFKQSNGIIANLDQTHIGTLPLSHRPRFTLFRSSSFSYSPAHLPSSVLCNLMASPLPLCLSSCLARSRSHSPGRRDRRGPSSERRREERERERHHPSSGSSGLPRGHSRSR